MVRPVYNWAGLYCQSSRRIFSEFENTPFGLARALRVSSPNDNAIHRVITIRGVSTPYKCKLIDPRYEWSITFRCPNFQTLPSLLLIG